MNHKEGITKLIKLIETSMLRSSLCDYSDAYILIKKTLTVSNTAAQGHSNNVVNK